MFCIAVLGNHDYRGNVEAQLSPVLTELDGRWLCMRSFIVDAGINITYTCSNPVLNRKWISVQY